MVVDSCQRGRPRCSREHLGRTCQHSCGEAQPSAAEKPAHSASGLIALAHEAGSFDLDVLYHYDDYDEQTWLAAAPTGPALGRATGVSDRGQRAAIEYDGRGNAIWTARQMALISDELALSAPITVSTSPADLYYDRPAQSETGPTEADVLYDADHTYVRSATFDHAGRPLTITLPEDPDFAGTAPTVGGSRAPRASAAR